jgi:acylphosphatase
VLAGRQATGERVRYEEGLHQTSRRHKSSYVSFVVKGMPTIIYNSDSKRMQGILVGMIEMYAVVAGKVQGVRYRTYVQESATELGLVGYVRNLTDGTVEVVAQGLPDTLKEFVEYLNEGSLLAKVESVSIDWRTARTTYDEFSLLH